MIILKKEIKMKKNFHKLPEELEQIINNPDPEENIPESWEEAMKGIYCSLARLFNKYPYNSPEFWKEYDSKTLDAIDIYEAIMKNRIKSRRTKSKKYILI